MKLAIKQLNWPKLGRLLCAIGLSILAGAEIDLFLPGLTAIKQQFELSSFDVQLCLSLNALAYCFAAYYIGLLGDQLNRRRLIIIGLSIYLMGTYLCLTPEHYGLMLAGRILQGVGMAAPAVLCFVIIFDDFSSAQLPSVLSLLQGIMTISAATAPIIGASVIQIGTWQDNFTILFVMAKLCLLISILCIQNSSKVLHSDKPSYRPLLGNRQFLYLLACFNCLVIPYWIFSNLSALIYIEDFNLTIAQFGFYQSSLAFCFATVSLLIPFILRYISPKQFFIISFGLILMASLGLLALSYTHSRSPLYITANMFILSIGVVYPISYLYPLMLGMVANCKSRAAALILCSRLILSSALTQTISYFHHGEFNILGYTMFASLSAALCLTYVIFKKHTFRI